MLYLLVALLVSVALIVLRIRSGNSTTAPSAVTSTGTTTTRAARIKQWSKDHWWILAPVGAVIVWFAVPWGSILDWSKTLTAQTVGNFFLDFWVLVLVTLAAVYGIIAGIVPEKFRMAGMATLAAVAVVLVIGFVGTLSWFSGNKSKNSSADASAAASIPLASRPQSEWPRITLAPGERSELIRRPPGMHIMVAGWDVNPIHVYQGGVECTLGPKCPHGSLGTIVENIGGSQIEVAYAFERD